jgi:hypothetical protein
LVTNSTNPIEKAKLNVPVTIHEIMIVSKVPTILQLIDLAMLLFGLSELMSFV